jgi:hypothetical protein
LDINGHAPVSLNGFVVQETGFSIEDVDSALIKTLGMSYGNKTKWGASF